jgi:predicted dehydrogenase
MLDKQKDIDAVMVATPDHTHAVISMEAICRGEHAYSVNIHQHLNLFSLTI